MDRLRRKISLPCRHGSRPGPVSFVRQFSYKDIKQATNGFHRVLYSNSHGTAYRAVMHDGQVVLVKEVRDLDEDKNIFYREVQLLERIHHRHILELSGFSAERRRFLVFDNAENGSLKEHLNDPLKTPLDWRTRLKIAADVAAALEYLLAFNVLPMNYVSVSSSSILLDENFNAKLSDIGLLSSRGAYTLASHSACSKDCIGQDCGNIIIQLGVLILELITGQLSENGGADLIQWIQESRFSFSKSVNKMIDPDLGDNFDSRELKRLLAVARLCIKSADKPAFSLQQLFRYIQKK